MGHEAVAEGREPGGEPAVQRHVGQHARAVQEARLRGDEQQRGLRGERDQDESERRAVRPGGGEMLEQHGIERLAGFGGDAIEQVADSRPATVTDSETAM